MHNRPRTRTSQCWEERLRAKDRARTLIRNARCQSSTDAATEPQAAPCGPSRVRHLILTNGPAAPRQPHDLGSRCQFGPLEFRSRINRSRCRIRPDHCYTGSVGNETSNAGVSDHSAGSNGDDQLLHLAVLQHDLLRAQHCVYTSTTNNLCKQRELAPCGSACTPGYQESEFEPMRDQTWLSGAWNFRDVGGVRRTDGRTIKLDKFFRSSHLARLDEAGRAALSRSGITDVCDLRRDIEVERTGQDQLPPHVRLHRLPFDYDHDAPHEAELQSEEFAVNHMVSVYREFPVLERANRTILEVASLLAQGATVLVHCGAGKDRAGWVVATILRSVGVTECDIVTDYLRSNSAIAELRQAVGSNPRQTPESMIPLLKVREDYYESGMSGIAESFGSFANYLTHIGFHDDLLRRLETALVR
ncbi:hypothetical protein GIY30_23030 [Gordonia sp. HNM0687]|uniref:Tyrosine specific protein phosphatases domain-containing protein n=2 Tax=Gordonia mangrovi TaxID=2665643 RepID=A0A6L7GWB1_9ACTN|nr:hypothetical protein [Gordonia mangrovi]